MKLPRISLAISFIPALLIILYVLFAERNSLLIELNKNGLGFFWYFGRYIPLLVTLGMMAMGSLVLLSHFWKDSAKHPIVLGILSAIIQAAIVILLLVWIGSTGTPPKITVAN